MVNEVNDQHLKRRQAGSAGGGIYNTGTLVVNDSLVGGRGEAGHDGRILLAPVVAVAVGGHDEGPASPVGGHVAPGRDGRAVQVGVEVDHAIAGRGVAAQEGQAGEGRIAGVILGVILGVVLAIYVPVIAPFLEQLFGFQIMPGDVYYVTRIPSELEWADVTVISIAAFVLTSLATLYPARRAANYV